MSGLLALVAHSLRRRRGLIVAMSATLAIFQIVMILTARNFEQTGAFRQISELMPAFMSEWTNTMAASFQGFVLFGYSHPLVQLFLVALAISIGTEPVGEIETRWVDLLLARPVGRLIFIARSVVVLIIVIALAIGSMVAASWLGLRWLTPPGAHAPSQRVIASLAVNLAAVVTAWGGAALAIASAVKRRATAGAAAGFLAFSMFVLDYVGKFWASVKPYARVSPFHYFDPFAMIGGRALQSSDLFALAGLLATACVAAAMVYARRDL